MPSDYTHLHFGKKLLPLMPESMQKAVNKHRELFEIGLQGPDILFFHSPVGSTDVSRTGHAMHRASAKEFFSPAREVLGNHPNPSAALAYLAGFLGHYALDSTCHGYIENKIKVSGLTHSEIEKEFDRYLMVKDQAQNAELNASKSIVASKENAKVISRFFPTVEEKDVLRSLRFMRISINMLSGKGFRRPLTMAVFLITLQYKENHDLLRPKKLIPGCEDSDLRLEKLMAKAMSLYKRISYEYEAFLQGGAFPGSLTETFGKGEHWRDIPVLPFEEEKSYEV